MLGSGNIETHPLGVAAAARAQVAATLSSAREPTNDLPETAQLRLLVLLEVNWFRVVTFGEELVLVSGAQVAAAAALGLRHR